MANPSIVSAEIGDSESLCAFLSLPEIDQLFVKPLSQRDITIGERVERYFQSGFWLYAYDQRMVGCGAVGYSSETCVATLSTFIVHPKYPQKGVGVSLAQEAIRLAKERYSPISIEADSWEGNGRVAKALHSLGFEQVDIFEDPIKRPEGIRTVLYRMNL